MLAHDRIVGREILEKLAAYDALALFAFVGLHQDGHVSSHARIVIHVHVGIAVVAVVVNIIDVVMERAGR